MARRLRQLSHVRICAINTTASAVPKLWVETIEMHRQTVHDAVLDATAALVAWHDRQVGHHHERLQQIRVERTTSQP